MANLVTKKWLHDVPPTAGLTLSWRDFLPRGPSLEQKLANYLGVEYTQIESSGTAALVIALSTLKRLSTRRAVILTAYTCPWVAFAVVYCNLKPVLCDTKKDSHEMCPEALTKVCDLDTLAIVPTHLAGRVADLDSIFLLAKKLGAYVIEDAAQSLGAQWHAQPVGTFGDIGFYSLGVGKGLTIYTGGVLVARDGTMRRELQYTSSVLTNANFLHEAKQCIALVAYYFLYHPLGLKWVFGMPLRRQLKKNAFIVAVGDDCSLNIRMHRVGAWRNSVGANAFARIATFLEKNTKQALHRKSLLNQIKGIKVIDDASSGDGVWPFLLVLMPSEQSRDMVLATLWQAGLGVGRLFIHVLSGYNNLNVYFPPNTTPHAQDFSARILEISNSPWLQHDDFMKIYQVILAQVNHVPN